MSQSHVSNRRIIKCKDGNTASLFQKGEIYAFGPLYEEIIKPEVPAGDATQDVLRASQRQRIKPAAEVAWEYLLEQTRLDPDLMKEIRGGQTFQGQITDNNPNVEQARDDHIAMEITESNTDQNVTEPEQSNQNVIELAQGTGQVIEQAKSDYDDKGRRNSDEMKGQREGDSNSVEHTGSNIIDQNVQARAQGSQTGTGQNAGGEGNVPEITEATEIDEEYTGGNQNNVTELGQSSNQNYATEETEGDQNAIQEENMIKEYYSSKIGEVIKEAMSAYYDDKDRTNRDEMQESCFKTMMINHGCLFLLQMFFFLGLGVDKLEARGGLHEILFGSDENDYENRKSKFSKCMMFPGNQIPLVVLNKLIQHSFFKKVALEEDWKIPPSSDPVRSVVYDLILDPVLKMNRSTYSDNSQTAGTRLQGLVKFIICGKQNQLNSTLQDQGVEYTDILHGLHCRWVGTARGEINIVEDNNQNGNVVDLESGIERKVYLDPKDDEGQRIPSATKMYSKGIDFKAISGMAIREIQIKDSVLGKVLHLPVFTFNEMTKDMYTSLKAYENDQGLREREVSEYLRFLCDIVRTDQDAALLEQKGVIKVEGGKVLIDEVAVYLKRVACAVAPSKDTLLLLPLTSTNLRKVKLDIIQYHLKPWYSKLVTRALLLSFFSLLISIISATFSILSYYLQRERHHH